MGKSRKPDLDHRLKAYFSNLRSSSLKDTLKRSAGNWQLYAAVTSSTVAMVTSASASAIGAQVSGLASDPVASARTAKLNLLSSRQSTVRQRHSVSHGAASFGRR